MATSRNITFYFNNQTAYDMVSDGVLNPWGDESSGKFSKTPATIKSYVPGIAFTACGDSDTDTGVTGAVNYWFVSVGQSLNSSKSNTKGSITLYFSIAYDHNLYSNTWSHHNNTSFATATYSGFSSSADSVNVTATYTQAQAAVG